MISSCACFSGKKFLFIIQEFGGEKKVDFFTPIISFSFWVLFFIHGFHEVNWLALLFQVSRPWLPRLNLVMVKRVCFCEIVFYSRHLSFVSVVDKNKYRPFIRRNMYRVHGGLFVQYQEYAIWYRHHSLLLETGSHYAFIVVVVVVVVF